MPVSGECGLDLSVSGDPWRCGAELASRSCHWKWVRMAGGGAAGVRDMGWVAGGGKSPAGPDSKAAHSREVGQQVLIEGLLCVELQLRRERCRRHCEPLQHLLRVCPGWSVLDAEESPAFDPQGASYPAVNTCPVPKSL